MKSKICKRKRIVSTFLALCMILTLLPAVAQADHTRTITLQDDTVITLDQSAAASNKTWSYDGNSHTLTLSNFTGKRIGFPEGNLVLEGENHLNNITLSSVDGYTYSVKGSGKLILDATAESDIVGALYLNIENGSIDLSSMKITGGLTANDTQELSITPAKGSFATIPGSNTPASYVCIEPKEKVDNPTTLEKTLSKIEVTTPPAKTSYQINEKFDKTGMVVTATYSDNTTAAVTDYTLSIGDSAFTAAGEITIAVSYEGKTATFTVNVTPSGGSETTTIKPIVAATPTTFTAGTTEVKVNLYQRNVMFASQLNTTMFTIDPGTTRLGLISVELVDHGPTAAPSVELTFTDTSYIGGHGPARAGELKITAKASAFTRSSASTVVTDADPVTITITDSSTGTDTPNTPDIPPVIDIPFTPSTPSTGGTSTGSTPSTDTTPDGSSTTTKTDAATGTVTETTKGTDGSETVVETKTDGTVTTTATDAEGNKTATTANPDGSAVTTITNKDGGASTTTVSATGQVTAAVTAPAAAVAEAQTSGQAVPLPMPEVPLTADASAAPIVTVTTGSDQPVKVEIPVEKTTPGTVAVIVKADGTEEVVKTSLATDTGVTLAVPDGATVKIVDNSKSFADAASHWAGDAITFATAHELFNGTGADSFTPNGTMTRGMMVTVLARYDGVDTSAGATWYEKGVEWAAENNISSGADLDAPVSREQLAAMLYRYAAASGLDTAASSELTGFADAGDVSGYAAEAMAWAVGAGLIGGTDKGELNPSGSATRAEVATILMRFCENVMK